MKQRFDYEKLQVERSRSRSRSNVLGIILNDLAERLNFNLTSRKLRYNFIIYNVNLDYNFVEIKRQVGYDTYVEI